LSGIQDTLIINLLAKKLSARQGFNPDGRF
jgi:hypothetical protein